MHPLRIPDGNVSASAPRGRGGIFYGWWVLAAASSLGFVAFGVVIPGYLAFSVPIRAELGLSSAQSAFVVGASWGVGDITSLGAGWLADRFGARRLILAGTLLAGAGFAALGFAHSFWAILIAYSIAGAMGRGLGVFPTPMTCVNQWFERRKALAIAIFNTSVTAGAAAMLPALNLVTSLIGWRYTAHGFGILMCVWALPAVAVIRSRPEDLGLQPYGAAPLDATAPADRLRSADDAPATIPVARDYTALEAITTLSFCALAVGAILRTVASDVLVINQIPILVWKGVSPEQAAYYLSLTYVAILPFRFIMGLAATWISPRWLLTGSMLAVVLCSLGALLWSGETVAWFLILASGIGQGVSTVAWLTVGTYYGRRSFGTLIGMMTLFYGISGLIMPALAGSVFDRTGSFVPVLVVVGVLQAVSAGSFTRARRPNPARAHA